MGILQRGLYGLIGGLGGTLVLTGFRQVLSLAGLVGATAPEQVIARLEEFGILNESSSGTRRVFTAAAHLAYGAGIGAALGLLRRERGGAAEEAAVGSALGLLAWGANWSGLLPLTGIHQPPWKERTPKVILPVLDHLVFGAAWAILYRAVRSDRV